MTLVTPSLVFCKVSIVFISILIRQTLVLLALVHSTTLLVIRVLHLMTQVCSTAHMFPSRWFVPLERTPSSLRSASRPVTVSLLTHLLTLVPLLALLPITVFKSTRTATTEEFAFSTSCDSYSQEFIRGPQKGPFFYLNKNKKWRAVFQIR